jgi:hypothetical protein
MGLYSMLLANHDNNKAAGKDLEGRGTKFTSLLLSGHTCDFAIRVHANVS